MILYFPWKLLSRGDAFFRGWVRGNPEVIAERGNFQFQSDDDLANAPYANPASPCIKTFLHGEVHQGYEPSNSRIPGDAHSHRHCVGRTSGDYLYSVVKCSREGTSEPVGLSARRLPGDMGV
jgi:hypothetical protein